MQAPTLLILAAGMGSRFGGLKQITPFGPNGETLVDYSLYDARRAGFTRAVFVVKPEIEDALREHIAATRSADMQIDYVYQRLDDLPGNSPEGREKPWGTGHAVYAARHALSGAFGVIGADDFFGRDAFEKLYGFLSSGCGPGELCMVGYRLENTLSESGAVSRGVCETADGRLLSVTERTRIARGDGGIYYEEGGQQHPLDPASVVSLNVWGLHAGLFDEMERDFARFLAQPGDALKREYYLPAFVDGLIRGEKAQVRALEAASRWYGVTNREDAAALSRALLEMHERGVYPALVGR